MEKYEVFNNSFLCCATYLNPEYRDLMFCSDKEKEKIRKEAKNYTLEYFKTVNPTTNEPNETTASDDSADSFTMRNASKEDSTSSRIIDKEFSSLVKTEFDLYSKTISKLKVDKFWCAHENNFPNLSKFARIVLTPPATSCPSERVFSAASNQIWARRNRLAAASVEKIMFLLNNLSDDISLLSLNE